MAGLQAEKQHPLRRVWNIFQIKSLTCWFVFELHLVTWPKGWYPASNMANVSRRLEGVGNTGSCCLVLVLDYCFVLFTITMGVWVVLVTLRRIPVVIFYPGWNSGKHLPSRVLIETYQNTWILVKFCLSRCKTILDLCFLICQEWMITLPWIFSIYLYRLILQAFPSFFVPRRLTCISCTNGFPCSEVSEWVCPMRMIWSKLEKRRDIYSPKIPSNWVTVSWFHSLSLL
jgi:hypothetical protein